MNVEIHNVSDLIAESDIIQRIAYAHQCTNALWRAKVNINGLSYYGYGANLEAALNDLYAHVRARIRTISDELGQLTEFIGTHTS